MDTIISTVINILFLITFALSAISLFLLGAYYLTISIIYLTRTRHRTPVQFPLPENLPRVTIQLPIYNERFLVERLMAAVTNLDYPKDLLQIQVLDDSTDFTSDLLHPLVEKNQLAGFDILYLHRTDRTGFKAGNLMHGMAYATGELIAIFDADSVPESAWLKKVVPYFAVNPKLGWVQTRCIQINDKTNLITGLQTLALDAFFLVEYPVRQMMGLMQGFSGSAGMWRKECIEQTGGWQFDSLTEDRDLSTRSQVAGWQAGYVPEALVASEVPAMMDAFLNQQYRWAKGHIQDYRKSFMQVVRAPLPWKVRLESVVRYSFDFSFLSTLLMLLLSLPIGVLAPGFFTFFAWTFITSIGPPLYYFITHSSSFPKLWQRIFLLPGLALLGIGISFSCGFGVLAGLLFKGGQFVTTPKDGQSVTRDFTKRFRISMPTLYVVGELAMGVYLITTVLVLWPTVGLVMAPWLLSSAFGYIMVASFSIWQL
ncbi:MAG TPA: glycosyltransferase family 2 protein, partial [Anaerolineaceae bacterium]|nr:glycosyltransferase family 2 protein [Anaerolineaceae bacterium]